MKFIYFILVLSIIFLNSCGNEPTTHKDNCKNNADCNGYICDNGTCKTSCELKTDCDTDFFCADSKCDKCDYCLGEYNSCVYSKELNSKSCCKDNSDNFNNESCYLKCEEGKVYSKFKNECISECSATQKQDETIPVCICKEEYSGNDCLECNEGYQDNDNDGICKKNCELSLLNCSENSDCNDLSGTSKCVCNEGYQDNDNNGSCLAGCELRNCGFDGICDDSSGEIKCECNSGYVLNEANICIDIDECEENHEICGTGFVCHNKFGSYSCVDINECELNLYTCDVNAHCINSEGNYTCECNEGFSGNGILCDDTNECENNTHNCETGYRCNNLTGSFDCIEIDECEEETYMCGPNSYCENTDGSYLCECETGFRGNGINCRDIDECEEDSYFCGIHSVCNNTIGSYTCECDYGYINEYGYCNNVCGDNIIVGYEECDNTNFNGNTCNSLNYTTGILQCNDCYYNTNDCRTTKQFGTNKTDNIVTLLKDNDDNLFAVGYTENVFEENVSFGSYDLFIAKYNHYDELEWIKQSGTNLFDLSLDSVIDNENNIYVTGITYITSSNTNSYDCFINKYDSDGNQLWSRSFGTITLDRCYGIAIDNNYIYVTGSTSGSFPNYTQLGFGDIFIAKYTKNGEQSYIKQFGTVNGESGRDIAVNNDYIYITGLTNGNFNGTVNYGSYDAFIMKLNNSSEIVWTKQFGTTGLDGGSYLTISRNTLYIGGYTNSNLFFEHLGSDDIFIMSLNTDGDLIYSNQFGSSGKDMLNSISVNGNFGDIFITGYTAGDMPQNTNSGGNDVFISKLDRYLYVDWIKQLGGINNDSGNSILYTDDKIYFGGQTLNSLDGNLQKGLEDSFIYIIDYQ